MRWRSYRVHLVVLLIYLLTDIMLLEPDTLADFVPL